jgi:hypothetical protein
MKKVILFCVLSASAVPASASCDFCDEKYWRWNDDNRRESAAPTATNTSIIIVIGRDAPPPDRERRTRPGDARRAASPQRNRR